MLELCYKLDLDFFKNFILDFYFYFIFDFNVILYITFIHLFSWKSENRVGKRAVSVGVCLWLLAILFENRPVSFLLLYFVLHLLRKFY